MSTQVLLADDDVELSAMLKEYLEREGFAVTAVHDGEAAARLAPGGAYQIVVLDVMMPKLDGVEALRRIRQASRVPVIMLTARGDDVDRIVGLELGADDYVPKPCTPRRSEEHTSELQSQSNLVCRLLLEKKNHYTSILRHHRAGVEDANHAPRPRSCA